METEDTQFNPSHIQFLLNFKIKSSSISNDKSNSLPDLNDDNMKLIHEEIMMNVKYNEWENIIVTLSELKSQMPLPSQYSFYLAQAYYYVKLYIGTINLCYEYINSHGVTLDIALLISKCLCKVALLEGSRTWLSYAKTLKAKKEDIDEIESLIAKKREKMRKEENTFVLYMKNNFFIDAIDSISTIYKNALPGQISEMKREDWANLVKEVNGDPEKLHEIRIKSDIITESIKLMTKFGMFGMHSYQHNDYSKSKQHIPIHNIGFDNFKIIVQYLELPDIAHLRSTCRLFNEWIADNEIWKDICGSRSLLPVENLDENCYYLFKDYKATITIIEKLFNRITEIATVDVFSDVLKEVSKRYYLCIYNFWEELSSFLNVMLASPTLSPKEKELSFKILRILEASLKSPFIKDHEIDFIFELLILFATKNQLFIDLPPQSLIFARGYPDTELVSTYIALCLMKLNGIFLHDIEDIPQEVFLENENYPQLSGIWRGNFYFNIFTQSTCPEADMYMNLKFGEDGTVTGNGIDTYNKYEIKEGQYDTKNICFIKKYVTGEESVYIGISNPKGFGGTFKINETSGYFIIHKIPHLDKEKEKIYYNNATKLITVQKESLKSHAWKKERTNSEKLHLEMLSYSKMKSLLEKKIQTYSFMKNIQRSLEDIPDNNYKIYDLPVKFDENEEKKSLRRELYSKLTYIIYFCINKLISYNEARYNKFMDKLKRDQVTLEDLEYWSIFLNIPLWGFNKESLINVLTQLKGSRTEVKEQEKKEEKVILPKPVETKKKTKKKRKQKIQIQKEGTQSSTKFWLTVGAVTAAVSAVSILTYRFFKKQ